MRVAALGAAVTAAGALALAMTAGTAGAAPAPSSGCAAVSIITARASGEAAGEGIIGALAQAVQTDSAQSVSRASVSYPATLNNYASSSAQGTSALKTQLTNLVNSCPNSKVVLLGYSQGAHVIGDVVAGGGGGSLGATTAAISTSVSGHVVAMVQMGDPRFVAGKSFDKGTNTTHASMFPRGANMALDPFASRLQSFCDNNDPFCAGGNNTNVHLTYLNRYQSQAESFILGKIGG
jgi:hypothetical protein